MVHLMFVLHFWVKKLIFEILHFGEIWLWKFENLNFWHFQSRLSSKAKYRFSIPKRGNLIWTLYYHIPLTNSWRNSKLIFKWFLKYCCFDYFLWSNRQLLEELHSWYLELRASGTQRDDSHFWNFDLKVFTKKFHIEKFS